MIKVVTLGLQARQSSVHIWTTPSALLLLPPPAAGKAVFEERL